MKIKVKINENLKKIRKYKKISKMKIIILDEAINQNRIK